MMKIDRREAEEIFYTSKVVNTKIDHSNDKLCLIFRLENGDNLEMNYKNPDGEKTYFLSTEVKSI